MVENVDESAPDTDELACDIPLVVVDDNIFELLEKVDAVVEDALISVDGVKSGIEQSGSFEHWGRFMPLSARSKKGSE